MVERRGINRVDYRVKSVIVTCDTFEKFVVDLPISFCYNSNWYIMFSDLRIKNKV